MYFKHKILQVLYKSNAYSLRFPVTLRISYEQSLWVRVENTSLANTINSYMYLCVCNCCPIELVAHMDTGCLNKMYSIRKSEVCVAYIYGRISSFFQMCDTLVKYNWHEW